MHTTHMYIQQNIIQGKSVFHSIFYFKIICCCWFMYVFILQFKIQKTRKFYQLMMNKTRGLIWIVYWDCFIQTYQLSSVRKQIFKEYNERMEYSIFAALFYFTCYIWYSWMLFQYHVIGWFRLDNWNIYSENVVHWIAFITYK